MVIAQRREEKKASRQEASIKKSEIAKIAAKAASTAKARMHLDVLEVIDAELLKYKPDVEFKEGDKEITAAKALIILREQLVNLFEK